MEENMKFPNKDAAKFSNEIDEANNSALQKDYDVGDGPYIASAYKDDGGWKWAATAGFRRMVQSGRKFKWTLNERGDLGVVNSTLKHAVASGGGGVHTAGHGQYAAQANMLTLDNDTGHYQTTVESLKRSQTAWEHLGYNVTFKERVDYSKLF
jgi:hypothetical protein